MPAVLGHLPAGGSTSTAAVAALVRSVLYGQRQEKAAKDGDECCGDLGNGGEEEVWVAHSRCSGERKTSGVFSISRLYASRVVALIWLAVSTGQDRHRLPHRA
jgi:hypothetical protein